jgi:hypothetical protein
MFSFAETIVLMPPILSNNTGRMLPPTERLKEGEGGRMLPVLTDEGVILIHGAV